MKSLNFFYTNLIVLLLLCSFQNNSAANFYSKFQSGSIEIKRFYKDDVSFSYQVSQRGKTVFWLAKNSKDKPSHVFMGKVKDNTLEGNWWPLSGKDSGKRGSINLSILDEGYLLVVESETGGFPSKVLKVDLGMNGDETRGLALKNTFLNTKKDTIEHEGIWENSIGERCYMIQGGKSVIILYEATSNSCSMIFVGKQKDSLVTGKGVYLPGGRQSGVWNPKIQFIDSGQFRFTKGKEGEAVFKRTPSTLTNSGL